MKSIKFRFFVFVKAILLGLLIILFLIFNKNIERILLISTTIVIYSLLQEKEIDLNFFNIIIVGIFIGVIVGNLTVYWYINNREDNMQEKKFHIAIQENTDSKTAVVLIARGEGENFNPISILKDIYNNEGIIKKILAPIDVFFHKLAYEEMGSSKYNNLCEGLRNSLQESLGYNYTVYLTYSNSNPNIESELEKFIRNYDKIILTPLFLYENNNYKKLMNYMDNKILYSQTKLKKTPLLWESEKLSKQLALKVANAINSKDRSMTGIILIRSENNSNISQEKEFLNRIIKNMKNYEFDSNKILVSDGKNLSKSIKNNVYSLQEKGVSKIILMSTSNLMDDINTKRNINRIINDINEDITIQYIDGWGIGENLINDLEYKVRISNLKE